MPEIPLRTYVSQLDNLIERKQVDEVIAHCRHVLSLYPKHLDTYRLLGKALLEKGRHGDAADIFERVLSVVPDDFISQVGMSIVREDEANLEAALWHMERAFEAAPANGAIQQELCRLYGRRDGVVPSKARLTRGALARMYTLGGLYLQAEAELKAALTDEPDRIDLQTILAQVYWQTEQPAQAAQTSAAILQKLPYSLEANRILLNVFREQGRGEDAAVYRQRLEAVDPYQAFADPAANGSGSAQVDPAKVVLSRLEYVTGMEDSGSPDWLASIGARFEEPAAAPGAETQPDWLTAATEAPVQSPQVGIQSGSSEVPDWLKDLEPAGGGAPAPAQPRDWMKDLGLGTEPLPTDAGAKEGLPDWLRSATGPLAADGSPAWMPPAAKSPAAEPAGLDAVTGPIPEGSLPDWMLEPASRAPQAAEPQPLEWSKTQPLDEMPAQTPALDQLPDWLKAIAAQPMPDLPPAPLDTVATAPSPAPVPAPTPAVPPPLPTEPAPILEAGEVPAWLQSAAPASAAAFGADDDMPDWLKDATAPTADPNALPDWLRVATGELNPATVDRFETESPAATSPESPTALAEGQPAEPEAPEREPDEARDVPAWMTVAAGGVEVLTDLIQREPPAQADADALAELSTPASEPAAEPDWLAADITGRDVPPAPDWFNLPAEPAAAEAISAMSSELTPVEPAASGDTPDWLQRIRAEAAEPAMVTGEPEPPAEVPDWLSAVGALAPSPDGGEIADITKTALAAPGDEPIGQPALELPPFLRPASPEAIARSEQPYNFETDEVTMAESNDDDEAPLPAEIPDWLRALAPVSPDPVMPEASLPGAVAEPAPTSSDEESFSWLAELKAQAAANTAAAGGTDVPDWLATGSASAEPIADEAEEAVAGSLPPWAEPQAPGPSDTIISWLARKQPAEETLPPAPAQAAEPEMPAEPAQASLESADIGAMDSDAAFAWLESLAARQGANPDELLGETAGSAEPAADVPSMAAFEASSELAAEPALDAAQAEAPVEPVDAYAGMPDWLRPGGAPEMAAEPDAEMAAPVESAAEPESAGYAGLPDWLRPGAVTEPEEAPAEAEPEARAEETAFSAGYDTLPDWLRPGADAEAAQSAAAETEEPAPAAEGYASLPEWLRPESATEPMSEAALMDEPVAEAAAEVPAEAAAASEPPSLPEWLREMEAAMPVEPLIDTAPSKARATATSELTQPAVEPMAAEAMAPELSAAEPAALEPMSMEAAAEPEAALSDEEAAMRWLEGLAAQQGANADELFTEPEARPISPPSWITAEQMRAMETAEPAMPEAAPEAAAEPAAEPAAMDPDAALRWLESLNARQTEPAEPETTEEPAEAPPAAAEVAAWFAEPLLEAPGTEAELAAQTEPEAETVEAEPPEWLKAYVAAEPEAELPAEPAAAPEPTADAFQSADVDKLSRLSERLAATRGAREQEAEARFAEQRERDEEARRLVQERMEARWATEAADEAKAPTPTPEPAVEAPPAAAPVPEKPTQAAPAYAPVPTMSSEALTEIMVVWTQRVEAGQDLPAVIREMENVAPVDSAPVPVVQLLGDAYVRANQLQKALDTYRQALRRL